MHRIPSIELNIPILFCFSSFREYRPSMHLYLAGNNELLCSQRLGDSDCEFLARFLDKNPYVASVDLRYNEITDTGAQTLAKMLAVSCVCAFISLSLSAFPYDFQGYFFYACDRFSTPFFFFIVIFFFFFE